jgi:hypothetical protein
MTTQESMLYEKFGSHVELREEIVRHADIALARAIRLRNVVAVAAILLGIVELVALLAPAPWFNWSSSAAMACAMGGTWLFAVANAWSCRQRANDSREMLLEYVSRLPIH